jgi:hypothetical protein
MDATRDLLKLALASEMPRSESSRSLLLLLARDAPSSPAR